MFKAFEVDYTQKCYPLGIFDNLADAKKAANKAYRKSHGEFPVFVTNVSDRRRVVYNRG